MATFSDKLEEKELLNPRFCVLEILESCMLRCKMCGNWRQKENPHELSIEEWKKFIISLYNQISNNIELNLAGGEPLLKKGILDLAYFISQQGFKVIMVSNAYLINENIAQMIVKSGLNYLGISLDSLNEEIHDFLRGIKGTYSQVIKAIDYLDKFRENSFSVGIQTIIMKENLEEIIELARWVEQDSRLASIYFQAIVQPNFSTQETDWFTDNEWYKRSEFSFLWPEDKRKVCSIIDELIRFKRDGFKIANPIAQLEAFKIYFQNPQEFNQKVHCSKGKHIFSISPAGDIYLCHLYSPLGNIRNSDINIREIWYSQEANVIREKMANCQEYCGPLVNCYFEE